MLDRPQHEEYGERNVRALAPFVTIIKPAGVANMILKLTAAFVGLFLLGVGITATLKAPQEYIKDRSIASLAQRAKNQGKTKVAAPGLILDYAGGNIGSDEALQNYSVVIAEPIDRKSYISDSADEIGTAYKFRVLDILSQRNAVFCNGCPRVNDVSGKLPPALYNEFLLESSGGTVAVDGVEVTMPSGGMPKFEDGQRFLMFISYAPGGMATLIGGPSGLFRITSDESLEAIGNGKQRLAVEIATRFSKSLSRFKQAMSDSSAARKS
jgi:hypothetical protein